MPLPTRVFKLLDLSLFMLLNQHLDDATVETASAADLTTVIDDGELGDRLVVSTYNQLVSRTGGEEAC